jgi:hypothetical protein
MPVTSRNGLVVLHRRKINRRKRSERRSDMCVYNPMTGERTFCSDPPDIGKHYYPQPNDEIFVLLTAAPKMASTARSCCSPRISAVSMIAIVL